MERIINLVYRVILSKGLLIGELLPNFIELYERLLSSLIIKVSMKCLALTTLASSCRLS